jgi:hypothetical protein
LTARSNNTASFCFVAVPRSPCLPYINLPPIRKESRIRREESIKVEESDESRSLFAIHQAKNKTTNGIANGTKWTQLGCKSESTIKFARVVSVSEKRCSERLAKD